MLSMHAALVVLALGGGGETVLLDFHAEWCGPCKMMSPTVSQLEAKGYPVRRVNIDEHPGLAQQFRVTGIPCFVMLAEGREIDREEGATSLDRLEQMCRRAQSRAAAAAPANAAGSGPNAAPAPAEMRAAAVGPIAADSTPARGRPWSDQEFLAASVRIRVEDTDGYSSGSGTIVDSRSGEALVLTCGHIFREWAKAGGKGRVEVDLFGPCPQQGVAAEYLAHDEARDIGLLSIRVSNPVLVAPVADVRQLRPGEPVVTVGCNNGGDPTVRRTHVTSVNKFLGPPNVQVADLPVEGRSGGGLFTLDGRVVGVCNAADRTDREGLYAALDTVHAVMDNAGLVDVYRNPQTGADAAALAAVSPPPPMPAQMPGAMVAEAAPLTAPLSPPVGPVMGPLSAEDRAMLEEIHRSLAGGARVLCVVQSPGGREEVLSLAPAAAELVRYSAGLVQTSSSQPSSAGFSASAGRPDVQVICIIQRPQARSVITTLDQASPALLECLAAAARVAAPQAGVSYRPIAAIPRREPIRDWAHSGRTERR